MHVVSFLAIIQGWDQLVSACLGILAAGVAALGPKLLARAGEWLDSLKPEAQPATAGGATMPDMRPYQPPTIQGDSAMSTTPPPEEAPPQEPEPELEPQPPEEEPVEPEPDQEEPGEQ